ncbi:hypothetical protein [Quadrisphaera sp. KR29]|uniref:hypothetical protein n=1 Tax=Quadrisphaera sp. KR29 TaxID=3461391 RepID=UPI0040443ED7
MSLTATPATARHLPADALDLRLRLGEWLDRPGKKRARVTPHRWDRLPLLRAALIDAARQRRRLTYEEASAASDGIARPQGMGEVLFLIGEDCRRRGEPDLAALVVEKGTREVGAGFSGDAVRIREACYARWS